jgi:ABC-type nickel/cobalt efflux system permease component RcnA
VKRLVLLGALLAALLLPAAASAHPLGNFTINHFARIEVSGHRLYVRYVLDMAEIPTFQARQQGVNPALYARSLAQGLKIELAGRPVTLTVISHALAFPRGAAGLHTMRLELILKGPLLSGRESLSVHDTNYSGRLGWQELLVGAKAKSESSELRAYPKSLLQSPLHVTSLKATVSPTTDPPPGLETGKALQAPDRVADSGFTSLIGNRHLSLLVILASLVAAVFWGAAHALSPGHGKTIVTAYLVGQRGTPRHAALLGLTVTVTHTLGVFALGLVTLALSQFLVPDTLYPWLNLVAGTMVVAVGLMVLRMRLREWRHSRAHAQGADHQHGHSHGHVHATDHADGLSTRKLLAVGISGGLLPCPSALVVLLAAISLHRVAFGLLLIVAFSIGLAAAITGVGLIAVLAKQRFAGSNFNGRLLRALPAVSALVILVAGAVMTVHAIPKVR